MKRKDHLHFLADIRVEKAEKEQAWRMCIKKTIRLTAVVIEERETKLSFSVERDSILYHLTPA